jgi:hypothetical protein
MKYELESRNSQMEKHIPLSLIGIYLEPGED